MQEIKNLAPKELQEFGIVTGSIFAALFGLFFPWLFNAAVPFWPWVLAGILVTWALSVPGTLQPVYRAWMRLGLMIGSVTTPLILGFVFFVMIMPMGLVMRALGKDPMAREFDDQATSYRIPSHKTEAKNIERPF